VASQYIATLISNKQTDTSTTTQKGTWITVPPVSIELFGFMDF
jgi:hypothetical protein